MAMLSFQLYIKDHLGNIRAVVNQNNSIEEINHYYPYGSLFGESTGLSNETQPYKYTGKELDRMHGLDLHDQGARWSDTNIGRWYKMDLKAEDYTWMSPYVLCLDNPVTFIDKDGKDPGDFFLSAYFAALDFGKYYNTLSIKYNAEYAAFIYKTHDKWGNIAYSYTIPNKGTNNSSVPTLEGFPNDGRIIADIHSHADHFDADGDGKDDSDSEHFSQKDIDTNNKAKIDGYLTTPEGNLLHYDHKTQQIKMLNKGTLPKSDQKGVNMRAKTIKNVYHHKYGEKTIEQRRKKWYNQMKKESFLNIIKSFL